MRNGLLYINDRLVDLYPNTVVAQTIQSFDINVGSIKTNFTNSIKVPKTPNNQITFEFADDIKSGTTVPYSELSARYVSPSGIDLIKNGKVIFKEADNDFILNIYSGPFGFFDFILLKKLWDLDFTGVNGAWTNSARDTARNSTSGVIAPLADDGQLSYIAPNIILTSGNNMRPPWVFYHTVLEKIVSSAGYTITGDILNDTFYKTLVMPLSLIYSPQFIEAKTFAAAAPGTQVMVNPANVDVTFDTVSFNGADNFYDGTSRYIVDNPDTALDYFLCQFIARLAITVTGGTVDIELIRNNAGIGSIATVSNVGTGIYELVGSPDFPLKDNDQVYVRIRTNTGTPTVTITEGRFYSLPKTGREDESILRTTIVEDFVYFNHLFEDINQLDFIKDFCIRFNVKIIEVNGALVCKSMNDILADTENLVDWTGKRATDRKSKLRFNFGSLSQVNNFTYSGDGITDDLSEDYGNGYFEIPNVNIPETGTVYNSIFLKTKMVTYQNAFIAYVNTSPLSITTFENVIGKRLMLVRSKYTSEPNVTYNVTPRSDYKIAYFIDPKQAFSMHWQYFIDNYYADFATRIAKTKVKTDYYYLTDLDIATFNNLKMIHDDGVNYLVTKINNYISGKISEVELFKVS